MKIEQSVMQCSCNWYFLFVCVKSTVRSPVTVQTYKGRKQGGKHAGENLAILDRTHLHKHGTLSPESLHAESQWDQPKRVGQEVYRSELGDLIAGVIHGSLPHARMVAETMYRCQQYKREEQPKTTPTYCNRTHSVTFEWHPCLRNNSKHLGKCKAKFSEDICKWTNKTEDRNENKRKPYHENMK